MDSEFRVGALLARPFVTVHSECIYAQPILSGAFGKLILLFYAIYELVFRLASLQKSAANLANAPLSNADED